MAYLVAVTACVSGVAHTYMAAERLEKLCLLEKWGVSIETQGALGTENRLADEDIRRADVALLITDIELAGAERFEHCRYVQCSIYAFLREPQRVMSAVRKVLSRRSKPILFWSSRFFCQLAVVLPTIFRRRAFGIFTKQAAEVVAVDKAAGVRHFFYLQVIAFQ